MTVRLVKAVMTCGGMPSQWDAWDAQGQYYYLRFRHGHGTIRMEPSSGLETWKWPHDPSQVVGEFTDENEWAGIISLEEFCERAGVELAPDMDRIGYAEYAHGELRKALAEIEKEKEGP